MNERYKAAWACLEDAKQHAVAAADYDVAAAINNLLDKFSPKPRGHTPGPWIKPQSSDGFTICGPEKNGVRGIICNVPALSENMEANADLIVAAPTTLDQRNRLVTALRNLLDTYGFSVENAKAQQAAGDLLRELGERE